MKLNLFRGISVSEKEYPDVINSIKNEGLYKSDKTNWGLQIVDFKDKINNLFQKIQLTKQDTYPEKDKPNEYTHGTLINPIDVICFADKIGAYYYALKHNLTKEKKIPIIIEIEIDIKDVYIDGNDLLYTVFGFLNPQFLDKFNRQKEKLLTIYGQNIEKYTNKIIENPLSENFAICDLVTQDEDIIKFHYNSKLILGGRNNTVFCSAFMVKLPINKQFIKNVYKIESMEFNHYPELKLDYIIER